MMDLLDKFESRAASCSAGRMQVLGLSSSSVPSQFLMKSTAPGAQTINVTGSKYEGDDDMDDDTEDESDEDECETSGVNKKTGTKWSKLEVTIAVSTVHLLLDIVF
jgi:hypothetical protein